MVGRIWCVSGEEGYTSRTFSVISAMVGSLCRFSRNETGTDDAPLELGILVWQDFQFACGVYPAHDTFVDSVRKEAVYNVNRLKHHPSIALFCGNNEDYQMVLQWGGTRLLPSPRCLFSLTYPRRRRPSSGGCDL